MNGIERLMRAAKAPEWQRLNELLRAWMKNGDLTDELSAVLVASGLFTWEGGDLLETEAGHALGRLLRGMTNVPSYDARTGRLSWRGRVVKALCREAPRQREVLEAFEQAGWQRLLHDPLPDSRRLLRRTVQSLNEGLAPNTIRFHTDGRGGAIVWWPVGG